MFLNKEHTSVGYYKINISNKRRFFKLFPLSDHADQRINVLSDECSNVFLENSMFLVINIPFNIILCHRKMQISCISFELSTPVKYEFINNIYNMH